MNTEKDKKIAYFTKIMVEFRDLESRFRKNQNVPQIIAYLMKIDFFAKKISKLPTLNSKEKNQLKEGNANQQTVETAQAFFLDLVKKVVNQIDKVIAKLNRDDTILRPNVGMDAIFKSLDQGDDNGKQDYIPPVTHEVCRSYFSNSSFLRMLEHANTGNMPPPIKKYLSVCFIDLVGFSTMSEVLDPAKVVRVLNYFFDQVNSSIKKYKGDIDKFIGDAMLVIFDSAENAVRCSIDILMKDLDSVNVMVDFLDMGIPPIKVHLGINTGWVVQANVGALERSETTVIGDGVNIAQRVQSLSPPNELWLTSTTMAALGKIQKNIEQIGRRKVKGRAHEVMVYRYIRKMPENSTVLLLEPEKELNTIVKKEMNDVGIKNIISVKNFEDLLNKIGYEKIKVIVVGPTVEPEVIEEIIIKASEKGKGGIPIIPIIRKKLAPSTLEMFENLGIKVHVPLEKKGAMEKVGNTLISEEVKDIPKIEKEPTPEEITQALIDQGLFTPPEIQLIEKPDEEVPEQFDEDESLSETEKMKRRIARKLNFSAVSNEVQLTVYNTLADEEFEFFKKELKDLWEYQYQRKTILFILNFTAMDKQSFDPTIVKKFLTMLDFNPDPKKFKIQVDFHNNEPIDEWNAIKGKFEYDFQN